MLNKKLNLIFIFLLAICTTLTYSCFAQSENYSTCIIPVKGMVDKGLSGFIKRAIDEAGKAGCSKVIFEIDTFGGRVDAAVEIRDLILDAPFDVTVAFINKRAISAGALIALSSKMIIMAEGGTIGAAQPVQMGAKSENKDVSEKYVSYLRKEFKATAETNGHPTEIAEAFVDNDVEIEGVIEKGKLLTLTSQEAKDNGLIEDIIPSMEGVFEKLEISKDEVMDSSMNWSEVVVRILTHPVLSSFLLSFGFLGIIFELRIPGFGVSGIIGVTCLLLFFLGHYLIGMAEWFDMMLFTIGVVLIIIEILVIPGFGITGIIGSILMLTGLFLSLIKREIPTVPIPTYQYGDALEVLALAIIIAVTGAWVTFKYFLPSAVVSSRLFLSKTLDSQSGGKNVSSVINDALLGKTGIVHTTLRPAGKAFIENKLYDVVSYDEFIEKGTSIIVKEATQTRIVVEELEGE
ncbi:MAG: ATP-dependent Clp protease proteolytic subunit [Candidatus Aureabacteria bacterium]|nr:ATP-dependent Clp protease proteolytic subunit [Candidatus Auribacterota bacterium]